MRLYACAWQQPWHFAVNYNGDMLQLLIARYKCACMCALYVQQVQQSAKVINNH